MTKPTFGSLFTGFDGVGIGARAAGYELAWGVELEPAIAEVANANLGGHVRVRNVLDASPYGYPKVDAMHASPPCTNASAANANGRETKLDFELASKVAEFIEVLRPPIFTLENVWAYRNFTAWRKIEETLYSEGYWVTLDHVNCADFSVPQTRKRMIVRAVLGGFVPYLPEPVEWVGWYAAIEDLIPTLPESQFAPWQMARLSELLRTTLVGSSGYAGTIVQPEQSYPSFTITAAGNQLGIKGFLVPSGGSRFPIRREGEHWFTLTSNHDASGCRALLMQVQGEGGDGVRMADEPMQTVAANHGAAKYRAWLVNESSTMEVRVADEPSATQVASHRNANQRALFDSGRVVAMTPRALARFQSFPDWYQLPDNARLAAKGIGNAVPPLLMQRIYEGMHP